MAAWSIESSHPLVLSDIIMVFKYKWKIIEKVKSIETIWTPDSTFRRLLARPSVGLAKPDKLHGGWGGGPESFSLSISSFQSYGLQIYFGSYMRQKVMDPKVNS